MLNKSRSRKQPRVYLEFTIGSKNVGRVTFELFSDITPLTAENFRAMCTGEKGLGPTTRAKLHYLGTKIHRVVDGFVLQGGDITKGDGTGGDSIYPERYFKDENFVRRHAHAGLLSMANCGENTNAS
jgi:cyclophilin family peptidyl-prolyl cis-trans isomerase